MMLIRCRWQKLGGHIHMRVFEGKAINQTFAKMGDLVCGMNEWDAFRDLNHNWIFVEEQGDGRAS